MVPFISAIVLAAGLSRRAAPHNKLFLPVGNTTVVRATVEAVLAAQPGEVIVVTGHERERVEAALADIGRPIRFVFAADFARGMGHSLAAGVQAASGEAAGFAIVPGDLPQLSGELVRKIVDRFLAHGASRHVIPLARGARGHPVILGAWLRPRLERLEGDAGARLVLAEPEERVRCDFYEVGNPAILRDVDEADR